MKFLLFSDIHGDMTHCEALVKKAEAVDVVIAAGDFCAFRKKLARPMAVLSKITRPTILVHGNHENLDELKVACKNWPTAHILHGTAIRINGLTFFGIGGAIPVTPFIPWSVDYTEAQAAHLLAACPEKSVLIAHSPPFHCLDAINPEQHIGSKSIRTCIAARQPLFVVCGHIHEEQNKQSQVGHVPVINAGPWGIVYEYPHRVTAEA